LLRTLLIFFNLYEVYYETDSRLRKKQFKARITKWGFDVKNLKGNHIVAMARARLNRKRDEAKDSAFRVNKRSVDERKIDRYLKRKGISEEILLSMPSPVNREAILAYL
jgi:hypothetical protein